MPICGNFRYTEKEDHIIIRAYCGNDVNVVVPEFIKGKPVQEISPNAFVPEDDIVTYSDYKRRCTKRVHSVVLPQTILRLDNAFDDCFELEEITIPQNAELIGDGCFGGCDALKAIYVDKENPFYVSKNGCLYSKDNKCLLRCPPAYPFNANELLEGVEEIGEGAFSHCNNLVDINIPGTVIIINSAAFSGCIGLKNITLHENVRLIGGVHFWHCEELENIIYYNAEGVIPRCEFNGCKNLKTVDIRSKVRTIGEGAFSGTGIVDFVIPQGTTAVNATAFMHCFGLKSIELPRSLSRIHDSAFHSCGKNYYTEEELADIKTSFGMKAKSTFIVVPGSKAEKFCIGKGYTIKIKE